MGRNIYTVDIEEISGIGNQASNFLIERLVEEGVLSPEQKKEIEQYTLIYKERNTLGSWFKKFWKKDDDSDYKIFVMKSI